MGTADDSRGSMRLNRLHIRRFKSLYDITWDPGEFSVLTGPNGSGKTNLVESLAFLGEVYQYGIDYAVSRAGGIEAIAFRGKRRTTIGIEFSVGASLKFSELAPRASRPRRYTMFYQELHPDDYLTVHHSFIVKPASGQASLEYSVINEAVSVTAHLAREPSEIKLFTASKPDQSIDEPPEVHFEEDLPHTEFHVTLMDAAIGAIRRNLEIALETYGGPGAATLIEWVGGAPAIRAFRQQMSSIKAYRLSPVACREPGVLTPTAALESHGGNLPAAVARLAKQSPNAWSQVLSGMKQIMPDLSSIEARPSPEYGLVLAFSESGTGRPWSAREISDGTVQALALLLALYDPRQFFIVVEEPENAVHPWILRRFLEQCRAQRSKQVVLTTHSPVVLRLARPDEMHLLWRTNGKTRLKALTSLEPDVERLYSQEGFDVFELYDSGMIDEAIPGAPRVMP